MATSAQLPKDPQVPWGVGRVFLVLLVVAGLGSVLRRHFQLPLPLAGWISAAAGALLGYFFVLGARRRPRQLFFLLALSCLAAAIMAVVEALL